MDGTVASATMCVLSYGLQSTGNEQVTYDCSEYRGWCLRHGRGCWTRCGTPWVKSVVINGARERVLVDEATCEPIRGGTNVSLGRSRCVEHDEDQRIRVGGPDLYSVGACTVFVDDAACVFLLSVSLIDSF